MRLSHEQSIHLNGVFITLTYSDDCLPEGLKKRHVQLALKRLRKELKDIRIRYIITGEYGDTFGRPHYHGIVFGLSWEKWLPKRIFIGGEWRWTSMLLDKVWKMGFNTIGDVNYRSIKYVCKYIHKQLNGAKAEEVYGRDIEWPFALKSQGLGRDYVKKNEKQLKENYSIMYMGREVSMPKYYKKKLYGESKEDRIYLSYRNDMMFKKYMVKIPGEGMRDKEAAIIRRNRGKEKIIIKDLKERGLEGM